ncbi:helix-turn-helix domain-containing protein [Candidatus Kaiserbacteria bacterium]|nr:helix-turn-helix domain-containing protein [Candidatus Kaiserbacteria bacterium]
MQSTPISTSPQQYPEYVSVKEAATLLGYTADYIARMARGGKIDGWKFGGLWYVNLVSAETFKRTTEAKKEELRKRVRQERLAEQVARQLEITSEDLEQRMSESDAVPTELNGQASVIGRGGRRVMPIFAPLLASLFVGIMVSVYSTTVTYQSGEQIAATSASDRTVFGRIVDHAHQLVSGGNTTNEVVVGEAVTPETQGVSGESLSEGIGAEKARSDTSLDIVDSTHQVLIFPEIDDLALREDRIHYLQSVFSDDVVVRFETDDTGVIIPILPTAENPDLAEYRFLFVPPTEN